VRTHRDWDACRAALGERRMFAVTTRGESCYGEVRYACDDVFVFGQETRGLPEDLLAQFAPARRLRLPMRPDNRSLNLSNAVAVLVFEAWRQLGFAGAS
jgi:tRNA (cytidine/uridine-2'-O-)-methyltransferase